MKKKDIQVGKQYRAKVSGKLTTVRVDAIREVQRYTGSSVWSTRTTKDSTVYDVTNLVTGRKTTFRSAAKFRNEAGMEPPTPPKRMREDAEAAAVAARSNNVTE